MKGRQPLPRTLQEPTPVYKARWIALTKGLFALVDAEDYDRVMTAGSWSSNNHGRAVRNVSAGGHQVIFLHQEVLGIDPRITKTRVDHINGDHLDNRKANLRFATQRQNMMNKAAQPLRRAHTELSGIKGVFRTKPGRFKVQLGFKEKTYHIGVFDRLGPAIKTYNRAAKILFGEFARLNSEDPELISKLEAKVPIPPPRLHREWGSKYERIEEKLELLKKLAMS